MTLYNGLRIIQTPGRIDVLDPNGWHASSPEGYPVASFNTGDGWIEDTDTGAVAATDDAMATVMRLIDNTDVGGMQRLADDGWTQCPVCNTLGAFELFCSDRCAIEARESED